MTQSHPSNGGTQPGTFSRTGSFVRTLAPSPPSRRLRLVAADPEPAVREFYRQALTDLGHEMVAAADGRELVALARDWKPDLLITEGRTPGLDGIEAANEVCRDRPLPVILVTAEFDPQVADRAATGPVLAYLIKPITPGNLAAAIAIARRRFEEVHALQREVIELRQALADRKVIERAKGVLMRKAALSEEEAFHRLQRLARDTNSKLVDVARSILTAELALLPAGAPANALI